MICARFLRFKSRPLTQSIDAGWTAAKPVRAVDQLGRSRRSESRSTLAMPSNRRCRLETQTHSSKVRVSLFRSWTDHGLTAETVQL